MTGARSESRQFVLLFRSFFARLFDNDLTPEGSDVGDAISWLIPLFAAPVAMVSLWLFPKYALVVDLVPEQFLVASRPDRLFFIGYSMAAVGLLTALVWDALFLDRRDVVVLGSLPVRALVIVGAKLASIVVLVLGFAVAINVLPVAGFTLASAGAGPFAGALRTFVGGFVATVAAGVFAFLAIVAVQTTLALLLPQRALRTVSVLAQLGFVAVLLEWIAFAPGFLSRLGGSEPSLLGEGATGVLPPIWFLGLNDAILGAGAGPVLGLARMAVLASAAALVTALVTYALSHRKLTAPAGASRGSFRAFELLAPREPTAKAVFEFVVKSLVRSPRHRLAVAAYLAVGLAFAIAGFLSQPVSFSAPTVTLLSIPLLLSFFALVGLRVLFDVPTELGANWVFRVTAMGDEHGYSSGVRRAMLGLALPPIVVATLPIFWYLWGARLAVGYTCLWLLLAALLAELLVIGFDRLPFTCAFVPGEANVKLLWPVYLVGMLAYSYGAPRLALWLLHDVGRFLAAISVMGLGLAVAVRARRRTLSRSPGLEFRSDSGNVQILDLTSGS